MQVKLLINFIRQHKVQNQNVITKYFINAPKIVRAIRAVFRPTTP